MNARYSRHQDFIAAEHQHLIGSLNVTLVGAGGLGSILAESLGRVGIGGVTVIDEDTLDVTNLNRWQGARPQDVAKPKARLLASRLRGMFPHMRVKGIAKSVFDSSVEPLFAAADLVVAGLDNDEARYFLNRVALQYQLPYFDAGVAVTGNGTETDFRVRYYAVLPGTSACLECTAFDLYDRARTLDAFTDARTAQVRRAAGYLVDNPLASAPSVYALNQRAASLLIIEALNYICGWRPVATVIAECWRDGTFQRADRHTFPEGPAPDCALCSFYAGVGDSEPLPRPRADRPQTTTVTTYQEVVYG